MDWKNKIDMDCLFKYIVVIMDGNGRWVKEKGKFCVFGYCNGVKFVWEIIEVVVELGVEYLMLYVFFIENWGCFKLEVFVLMWLLVEIVYQEMNILMENNICLQVIGEIDKFFKVIYQVLLEGIENIKNNEWMIFVLVLNYSGCRDIMKVV